MKVVRLAIPVLILGTLVLVFHCNVWPELWPEWARVCLGAAFFTPQAVLTAWLLWSVRRGHVAEQFGAFGGFLWCWVLFVGWLLHRLGVYLPDWVAAPALGTLMTGLILILVGERLKVRRQRRGDESGDGPLWLPRGPRG